MVERFRRPFASPDKKGSLFIKCAKCQTANYVRQLEDNLKVCVKCGHHFRLPARERIEQLVDADSFFEWFAELKPADPLGFADGSGPYTRKLADTRSSTGLDEAAVCGGAKVLGHPVVLGVMDFSFLGASMGSVVGEKVARSAEEAAARRWPFVMVCAAGGARMHEGAISLMQMAKTAASLGRLRDSGTPYIPVLTDPTTGGVTASFASLGDVTLAEPGALIGFAGPRVIEQLTRQKLPPGFQTAEFLLEHGMIDMVVPRKELRDTLGTLLTVFASR